MPGEIKNGLTLREQMAGSSLELVGGKVRAYFLDSGNSVEIKDADKNLDLLLENLDFQLARFYRREGDVLNTQRKTERKVRGNCNTATNDFGKQLATKDEDGESFFTELPGAKYFDLRANQPFKHNYGGFHSVGVIVVPRSDEINKLDFVCVDLTHNAIDPSIMTRSAVFVGKNEEEILEALKEYYGGDRWKPVYLLLPDKINQAKANEEAQPYEFILFDRKMTDMM